MSINKENGRVEDSARVNSLQEDMKVSERNAQRVRELRKNADAGGGDTAEAVRQASRVRDLPDKGKYLSVVA